MTEQVLVVVGVSWRTSPVSVREQVAFSDHIVPEALRTIRRFSGCHEALILSTCNRVELYAAADDAGETVAFLRDFLASFHDRDDPHFDRYCYAYVDTEAVRHLFRVAAGLDSMVVGENEILHQLKEAYKVSSKAGAVGGKLALLIEYAAKVGREIRRETKVNSGAISVATAACELAEKIFGSLNQQRVLVMGTGKMGAQTIKNLIREGVGDIVVAARNKEKGELMARPFGARVVDFSEWMRCLADTDIVIVSTGASQYVIRPQDIQRIMVSRKHKPLFIIDIAVPRNVDPKIDQLSDVYLYNIDDLKDVCESNLRSRRKEVDACQKLIEPRIASFFTQLEKLKAGPTIEALNKKFDAIADSELKRLSKHLGRSADQDTHIRRLIANIKGKFLHHPMTRIKEAAEDGGVYRYTETVRRLFELEHDEPRSAPDEQKVGQSGE